MAANIIQNVINFTDQYILMPYRNSSVVAALGDNRRFRFSLFGESTAVREITGVNSKAYDPCNGWSDECEVINPWREFRANIDREISFKLDLLREASSILPGMTPTGELTYEMSWRLMGAEIDAVSMGMLDSQIPTANKVSNVTEGFQVDPSNILKTLTNLEAWLVNNKVYGGAAVFMSASVFKNLRLAMIENYGLASGAMLQVMNGVANPVDRRYGESGRLLEVNTQVYRWGDLFIYEIPDDRMVNKVILLDGKSDGQKLGGWVPDYTDPDFHKIDIMVVPFISAAIGVRHIIKEVMVPSVFRDYTPSGAKLEQDLADLAASYNGVINIQNIGITQQGDMFRWVGRVVWGLPVFSNWAQTILEIYDPAQAEPTSITTVSVKPNIIPQTGGNVLVNINGVNLNSGISVECYIGNDLLDGAVGKTMGSPELQSCQISIPVNASTTSRSITIEVDTGTGVTHQETVTQNGET